MFEIDLFNEEVIKFYFGKKIQKELPLEIEKPSRAKLMNYCLTLLARGKLKKDIPTLISIFDPHHKYENIEAAIKKVGADKFRPLQDFIIQKTTKPTDNSIKLLSILIDFQPRPFDEWRRLYDLKTSLLEDSKDYQHDDIKTDADIINNGEISEDKKNEEISPKETVVEVSKEEVFEETCEEDTTDLDKKNIILPSGSEQVSSQINENTPYEENIDNDEVISKHNEIQKPKSFISLSEEKVKPKSKWFFILFRNRHALRALGGTTFVIGLFISTYYLTPKQCMCWVGDHYIAVDCQNNNIKGEIIALDEQKLNEFKKITKPDTLTAKDVNQVWYSKINNNVEFFTAPGFHPIHGQRSLKVATEHIIEQYAIKGDAQIEKHSVKTFYK
ncbi:hypothetical protein LZQ00_11275 [Sphingobacterium sp. SRCM116780]|uniref:hypothetical protein n=1 Tax=Sphingobacterium sp. SRCM116780 TaxID=2907623 RepID=UPI001F2617DE|nr:hypothetical protein [Sphingobacterium sp. SRCM116780]UIR54859.1 hypothetical protein LZQ00_11275 [Sphingobacterium sp. SRCM116780]